MNDFNDLHKVVGSAAVSNALDSAEAVEPEDTNDQLTLGRAIIKEVGWKNLLTTAAHVWMWQEKGVWRPVHDRFLKQIIQRRLHQMGKKTTRSLIDSVLDIIKSELFDGNHKWNLHADIINVANGELHFDNATLQFSLRPAVRENHCLTQIPVTYDPNATAPRFWQFLMEIFAGDPDCLEKATVILEAIGYTLCSHARFQTFVMLIGRGANGKSVILEIIRRLLGAENVSAVQPSQFNNRFQRAHLYLKLANIVTEIAEGAEIADAELKSIVSGEGMTAEEKHKPPFDLQPFCTVWIGTNHMPHTRDFSDGLFRRAIVVPFNRSFNGKDADPLLAQKLAEELPGILNMALTAYCWVLYRGTFTEPTSCAIAKKEWRAEADQAAQFIEECGELVPDSRVESKEVYQYYQRWASAVGIRRVLNHQNFTKRLERLGCVPIKGTNGQRLIGGLKITRMMTHFG
jgi:putative DNA primase/helicase